MVLLEILRVIVQTGYKPEKNIQIHGYAAEELGRYGSDEIAEYYKFEGTYYGTLGVRESILVT